jgi:Conjugative transposon, TraM
MESRKGANNELLRRKRKMMLVLPVVLIPLLTLGFYALGGGTGGKGGKGIVVTKGLNMSLPEAKFDMKKKSLNKLGFYRQSEQDSIKLRESRKHDPYSGWKDSSLGSAAFGGLSGRAAPTGLKLETTPTDVQAGDLMRKLDLLKGVLNRQQQAPLPEAPLMGRSGEGVAYSGTRLPGAALPSSVVGSPASTIPPFSGQRVGIGQGDPDLDKLNTLMDKVLRVRYPGDALLRDSAPIVHEERAVQALAAPQAEDVMTTLSGTDKQDLETGFIDFDEERQGDSLAENMIPAVVDGAQTLISGESVALRTAGEATLGGVMVPFGTALIGKATLSGERLLVSVTAVRIGSRVIPVALEVVGMDGMPGIRVKGSINRDVSKESADEAVGSLGLTTVDASVAGQATAAGLQATKNLLSRKIRLVRVGLPAGYRVLLRNSKVNR